MTREEARKNLLDIYELITFADEMKAQTAGIDKGNYKKYLETIQMAHEFLKTSRWKRFHIYNYGTFFECDNCGFEASDKFYYCPNCGAKMEGVYREQ